MSLDNSKAIGDINKLGSKDRAELVTDVLAVEARTTPIAVFINVKLNWLYSTLMS